ncbi:ATP-binding protein [Roseovarius ramblicola]|uniref:ATP-binding protein n=1 Tax=Roseovarius ramblicola TaxID=2022336 RepID=A0ABV5I2Z7_9RHOB
MTRAERRGAADGGDRVCPRAAPRRRMSAGIDLHAAADGMSVRALLAELRARLRARGLPEAACGTVEIVLAEALNNIVEHAYGDAGAGAIGLHAALGPAGLICTLRDRGAALPAPHLPAGRPPDMGTDPGALPEGGFGWFLIRSLTREVRYDRVDGTNRLTLRFDLPAPDNGNGNR